MKLKSISSLVLLALAMFVVNSRTISAEGGGNAILGTINYSFGKYEGYIVNGIPEGRGTMYYTCRIQVATHGRSIYIAESGYRLSGTWSNGDIVNGNLRDADDNQIAAILAGRRAEPHDLSDDDCLPEEDEDDEDTCTQETDETCGAASECDDN